MFILQLKPTALYSNPAVNKDKLLVPLQKKEMMVITIPLPNCPSSGKKKKRNKPFHLLLRWIIVLL